MLSAVLALVTSTDTSYIRHEGVVGASFAKVVVLTPSYANL